MEANAPCKRLFAAGQEEIIVELGIIARPEGIRSGNGVLDVGRSLQLTDDSLRMREERRIHNEECRQNLCDRGEQGDRHREEKRAR